MGFKDQSPLAVAALQFALSSYILNGLLKSQDKAFEKKSQEQADE